MTTPPAPSMPCFLCGNSLSNAGYHGIGHVKGRERGTSGDAHLWQCSCSAWTPIMLTAEEKQARMDEWMARRRARREAEHG